MILFKDLLKERLEYLELSPKEFGVKMRVEEGTVKMWLRGDIPHGNRLKFISKNLDMPRELVKAAYRESVSCKRNKKKEDEEVAWHIVLNKLKVTGICRCRNARFSRVKAMLNVCFKQHAAGNSACKKCQVRITKGEVLPHGTVIVKQIQKESRAVLENRVVNVCKKIRRINQAYRMWDWIDHQEDPEGLRDILERECAWAYAGKLKRP